MSHSQEPQQNSNSPPVPSVEGSLIDSMIAQQAMALRPNPLDSVPMAALSISESIANRPPSSSRNASPVPTEHQHTIPSHLIPQQRISTQYLRQTHTQTGAQTQQPREFISPEIRVSDQYSTTSSGPSPVHDDSAQETWNRYGSMNDEESMSSPVRGMPPRLPPTWTHPLLRSSAPSPQSPDSSTHSSSSQPNGMDRHVATPDPESRQMIALLHAIANDQAKKDGFVHRSITCNHCGTQPIRGIRYHCSSCVDYDLCETCEPLDVHLPTHLFLKIRVPLPPLANPRVPLLSPLYPGQPFENKDSKPDFEKLSKKTHFDKVELEAFYEEFKNLSTVESGAGGITREIFGQCLGPMGIERNLIVDRLFAFFDQDEDEIISFQEMVEGVSVLCKGSLDERIKYAFQGYDLDGDGLISREELQKMFKAYFHLTIFIVRDLVRDMEENLIQSFDDESVKPVSAAFSAPIPASTPLMPSAEVPLSHSRRSPPLDPNASSSNRQSPPSPTSSTHDSAAAHRRAKLRAFEQEYSGSILLEGLRTGTNMSQGGTQPSSIPTVTMARDNSSGSYVSSMSRQPASASTTGTSHHFVATNHSSPAVGTSSRLFRSPFMLSPPQPHGALSPSFGPLGNLISQHTIAQLSSMQAPEGSPVFSQSLDADEVSQLVSRGVHFLQTSRRQDEPPMSAALTPYGASPFPYSSHRDAEHHPIMEAMSQEAIEEMVEKTFEIAEASGQFGLTFEQFQKVVEEDSNLLSWFESLGSVF